ncbi:hypothetical protein POTOM_003779 [Populus tomentosa]|uniref:1-phosphatidylinositol-4-phosphate 5-kinase n=1 Tax=Populus tomentosa TaxID=118781 RepID=A0A8X8AUK3_POPTO|nr:hypothetical protein POTOM_003779 [Populus tomentosa]
MSLFLVQILVPSCRQVDRDCDFLEQERIMDYSLLVGLHFRKASYRESLTPPRTSGVWTPSGIRTPTGVQTPNGLRTPTGLHSPTGMGDETESGAPRLSGVDLDKLFIDPTRCASIKLGINMPARVEKTARRRDGEAQLIGEPTGIEETLVCWNACEFHSSLHQVGIRARSAIVVMALKRRADLPNLREQSLDEVYERDEIARLQQQVETLTRQLAASMAQHQDPNPQNVEEESESDENPFSPQPA